MAVGRVTQEHTRAHETPQPRISKAAQDDGLDECEVQHGAPHLGVQKGRVGGEGAAVAGHDGEVRRRGQQDEGGASEGYDGPNRGQDETVGEGDGGRSRQR